MLEVGGGLDLLYEPLGSQHCGEFGTQDFDGDLAVVLQIVGQIHRRHAAFAQVAFDFVAVGEGSRELGGDLGHRLVLVFRQQRLEPWMLTDRVPTRVQPQRVDAQVPWSCEELLDLVQRGIYLTSLREDPRTLRSDELTVAKATTTRSLERQMAERRLEPS